MEKSSLLAIYVSSSGRFINNQTVKLYMSFRVNSLWKEKSEVLWQSHWCSFEVMFLRKAEQVTWRILHVGVGKVGG